MPDHMPAWVRTFEYIGCSDMVVGDGERTRVTFLCKHVTHCEKPESCRTGPFAQLSEQRRNTHGGQLQLPVLHSLTCDELIRKSLQLSARTLHQQNLQVVILLKMDVHAGDDQQIVVVLD